MDTDPRTRPPGDGAEHLGPADPTADRGLEVLIQDAYDAMGPVERHLADVVLDHVNDLAAYNAAELATLSGASKATVSRFFRRLGFESFAAARQSARHTARSLRAAGVPVPGTALADPVPAHASAVEENLRRALATLDRGAVDPVADLLARAGQVVVVGFRNSYPVALHLREQLLQARPRVALAPQPGQSVGEELAQLGPGDAAVCVGFRRRPAGFAAVVDLLLDAGVPTVLLTDPGARRHVPRATHRLEVPVDGCGAFDDYGAAMTTVCVLADAVLDRVADGRERIDAVARAYRASGELEEHRA
ncbi:SIS domain-containing protein [Kineococcus siccus]|uniref:SIS domain-containing protein n=1 Tax=Kineococcus siccus TaxID=2696567 RepID=UPI00196B85C3